VRRSARKISNFWKILGPGFTTGAADDDPSGIATYSQAGSMGGYSFLWLAPLSFPLMALIQEMCARIGLATGRGLASNIRAHLPKFVLYLVTISLFLANVLNIGADLGAMAEVLAPFIPIRFEILVVLVGFFSLSLQVFVSYRVYVKYLKWLALALFSYVIAAMFLRDVDIVSVIRSTFIPSVSFNRETLFLICAVLGTTLSPYLFFWQTTQEVEDEVLEGKTSIKMRVQAATKNRMGRMRIDVWTGMLFSNLVMYFIILTTGTVIEGVPIGTANDAAQALAPLLGDAASFVFALGIIGTGLLAVPILAGSATYAVSEAFGIKGGLNKPWKKSITFYIILTLSMIMAIATNFVGIDPIKSLLYSAVVNGIISPLVIFCIITLASSRFVMGKHVNSKISTALAWILFVVMSLVAIATLFSFI
jgi:NRAMP (natural resistance-associated macrophage protein)-like metal ion transporter